MARWRPCRPLAVLRRLPFLLWRSSNSLLLATATTRCSRASPPQLAAVPALPDAARPRPCRAHV